MRRFAQFLTLLMVAVLSAHAVPAVLNYAGQVAVNGQPFDGQGLFKFALVNADGNASYWSNDGTSMNGSEPTAHVGIPVNGGLYSLLLGNTAMSGMGAIDPQVFAQHDDTKLRVWFSDGVNGFQQLSPDRPFASVPYAFSAGTAQSVVIADGSINKSMLGSDVIADLNRTITKSMLGADVVSDLNTTVSFPGTLISVPVGQSPPPGYSLHRSAEPNPFVWHNASNIDIVREGAGKTIGLNGKLYYLCGADSGSDPGKLCSVYDPNTDQWTPIAPSNYTSEFPGAIIHDGKIYLLNGKYLEIYDPSSNTWQVGPTMPTTESPENFGYTKLNGKIWAFGGYTGTSYSYNPYVFGYFYSFDLSNNTWQDESSLHNNDSKYFNLSIGGPKVLSHLGKMWVIGPKHGNILSNSLGSGLGRVFSFDPVSKSWKMETITPHVTLSSAWVLANRIFISRWGGNGNLHSQIYFYDQISKSWKECGHMPSYVNNILVANVGTKIFVTHNSPHTSNNYYADLNATFINSYDLYRKDGNASAGTPLVQAEVADGSVTTAKLAPEVQAKLDQNTTIGAGTITKSMLANEVLSDLNRTITKAMLAQEILTDLNATIGKDRLSSEVLSDLNRTITKAMLAQDILSDLNATIGLDRLSSEAISELNSSGVEDNSVTMAKLEPQLRADLNKTTARPFGATLDNPYGIIGTPVFGNYNQGFVVPSGKVLVVTSGTQGFIDEASGLSIGERIIVSENTSIGNTYANSQYNWTGILYDPIPGITPVVTTEFSYQVPAGKILVLVSYRGDLNHNNNLYPVDRGYGKIFGEGESITTSSYGWTGYLIDPTKF